MKNTVQIIIMGVGQPTAGVEKHKIKSCLFS